VDVKPNSRPNPEPAIPLPVLVPNKGPDPDGCVLLQSGKETQMCWVKHFVLEKQKEVSRRFGPIARLFDLVESGKPIDFQLIKEGWRALVGAAFKLSEKYQNRLTDAVTEQAVADQVAFARRWLPAVFNREIPPLADLLNEEAKGARIVMWWPEHRDRFFPAIYCGDRETALYISLLFRYIRLCPGCGVPFQPGGHSDQRFHSVSCATNYRMRRYRLKQQEKGKPTKKHRKGESRGKK
jgi:hypothetical protein